MKKISTIILSLIIIVAAGPVLAQQASTNYQIEESTIGPGGLIDTNSANYNARASLGDTGVGNSASTNYQVYAGYTTTAEEYLEMYVNGATTDLGVLTFSSAATTTGTFYVRSYLAQGYAVTTASPPPTSENGDQLDPITTAAASSPGTEQFGINLVANTAPTAFGANPNQIPDSTFSFGYAASGYDTPNVYQYNQGDIVAQADSSSGRTDYTISYIFNVNQYTPAGLYTINHSLVATSTF